MTTLLIPKALMFIGAALVGAWVIQVINSAVLAHADLFWWGLLIALSGAFMKGWYGFGKEND